MREVVSFIRDTALSINDDAVFFYARQSDFNSIKQKPKGIKVVLAPLDRKDTQVENSTFSEYRCVVLILQFDDLKGSEEETEAILYECDEFFKQFQAKLKLKSLNEDVEEGLLFSSDTTEISEENITTVIKITNDCISGLEYEFKLTAPDTFDYCDVY